jgi:hypothetical protein
LRKIERETDRKREKAKGKRKRDRQRKRGRKKYSSLTSYFTILQPHYFPFNRCTFLFFIPIFHSSFYTFQDKTVNIDGIEMDISTIKIDTAPRLGKNIKNENCFLSFRNNCFLIFQ